MSPAQKGILAAVIVCLWWGTASIFYKALSHVPAFEVLAWRSAASVVFFAIVLTLQGRADRIFAIARSGPQFWRIALASIMIATNWFIFIYAVQNSHAVEASLGYYVFPLVTVLLGRFFFAERLSLAQWGAVALAALAVALLTWGLGAAPWLALCLAISFSTYGALKKGLDMGPVVSVTAEVILLAPAAVLYIVVFGHGVAWDGPTLALLILAGPITGIPLILFSYAARRVRLSTLGLTLYLNPTVQFLVAISFLGEALTSWHLIAFAIIWASLAIYSTASLMQDRRARKAAIRPTI